MPPPLVSVFVPCYNYGRFLPECVNSILVQDVADVEVIIVDDGSTDETATVCETFLDPRVRVMRQPHAGLIAALNRGIAETTGKYVARIDADDRYRPTFLREAVTVFERHADVGLFYADVAAIDTAGRMIEDPYRGIPSHTSHGGADTCGDEWLENLEDNRIPAPAMMGRGDLYRKAVVPSWFSDPSPSDWYINLYIARRSRVYYRAATLADYRIHQSNMHRTAAPAEPYQASVLGVLDDAFDGDDRVEIKTRIRGRVYGRAYRDFANRYFNARNHAKARRCFLQAWRHDPVGFTRAATAARFGFSCMPVSMYLAGKRFLGR